MHMAVAEIPSGELRIRGSGVRISPGAQVVAFCSDVRIDDG
jgi:hypothetical protein